MKLLKIVVFILVLSAAGCQQPSIKKDIASKSSYKKTDMEIKEIKDEESAREEAQTAKVSKKELKMALSKDKIAADGIDFLEFIPPENESGVIIFFVNERKVDSNKFSTVKSGNYSVYCVNEQGVRSSALKFEALQKIAKVEIISDKTEVFSDGVDKVNFTLVAKDYANSEMKNIEGKVFWGSKQLEDKSFSSKSNAFYLFKGVVNGVESETVGIKFIPKAASVEMSASKNEILSDGKDSAEIIVKILDTNGNTMLGTRKLYMNDEIYNGTQFTSTKNGKYIFRAESEGFTSNEIEINVVSPKLPLLLTEQYPLAETVNFPTKGKIKVKFSQKLDKTTVINQAIKIMTGSLTVASKISYNEKEQTVELTPLRKLKNNTKYRVVITKELKDITGSSLTSEISWNFTTMKSLAENFVKVTGGMYKQGDESGDLWDDTKPLHDVKLSYSFLVSKYEMTFEEYDFYCEAAGIKTKPDDNGWGRGKIALFNVSWFDAVKYCNWLSEQEDLPKAYNESTGALLDGSGRETRDITKVRGYRLLTEAEWEFCARGGTKGINKKNSYSGSNEVDLVAWYATNSANRMQNIGKKYQNELGLYDMSGNAAEWCNDIYEKYSSNPKVNPIGGKIGKSRVVRGGSYYSVNYNVRNAYRDNFYPSTKSINIGFRIAKTAGRN